MHPQRHRRLAIQSAQVPKCLNTHHVFPPLHELLVNDLASIVFTRLDVYGFLHDSICTTSKRASCTILQKVRSENEKIKAAAADK